MNTNDMTPSNYNAAMGFEMPEIDVDAIASMEQDIVEEDPEYWEHYGFSPVEQGYYDDDPNPYSGDYSEM